MAFLCPAKIKRELKKKVSRPAPKPPVAADVKTPTPRTRRSLTGSASLDTLFLMHMERGDNKEKATRIITRDFAPETDDEIRVIKGEKVMMLSKEDDWLFVVTKDGREGYVPDSFCIEPSKPQDTSQLPSIRERPVSMNTSHLPRQCHSQCKCDGPDRNLPSMGSLQDPYRPAGSSRNLLDGGVSTSSFLPQQEAPCPCDQCNFVQSPDILHDLKATGGVFVCRQSTMRKARWTRTTSVMSRQSGFTNMSFRQRHSSKHESKHESHNINFSNLRKFCMSSDASSIISSSSMESLYSTTDSEDMEPMRKRYHGKFIVLFGFRAVQAHDLTIQRGEVVRVLNKDDPEWFWVIKSNGNEGYVPSAFIHPAVPILKCLRANQGNVPSDCDSVYDCDDSINEKDFKDLMATQISTPAQSRPKMDTQKNGIPDVLPLPTPLHILYDYEPRSADDLKVLQGDTVYAFWNTNSNEDWIWAYSPTHQKQGFVPRNYVRPSLMTSL